ncbi:MAG: hypothetical protein ACI85F_001039, partial [Bacteroidia bacterium]
METLRSSGKQTKISNLAACFADEGSVSLFEFRTS